MNPGLLKKFKISQHQSKDNNVYFFEKNNDTKGMAVFMKFYKYPQIRLITGLSTTTTSKSFFKSSSDRLESTKIRKDNVRVKLKKPPEDIHK